MIRIVLGVVLLVAGLLGLIFYHNALWGSGGPDVGRSQFQYLLPYLFTSALTLIGILNVWKDTRALKGANTINCK